MQAVEKAVHTGDQGKVIYARELPRVSATLKGIYYFNFKEDDAQC